MSVTNKRKAEQQLVLSKDDEWLFIGELVTTFYRLFEENAWKQKASLFHENKRVPMMAVLSCSLIDALDNLEGKDQLAKLKQFKPELHIAWLTRTSTDSIGMSSPPGFETYCKQCKCRMELTMGKITFSPFEVFVHHKRDKIYTFMTYRISCKPCTAVVGESTNNNQLPPSYEDSTQ
jgi:hypothetical protein